MSTKRPPAPPPQLPGFTYLELLGSGGFADVYLYEQQLPRRRVAVKVLLPDRLTTGSAEEFTAEANVMAMLSTHPAIVTIHQAGVAGDGRPYLVMEYCPKPNLQVRYRAEPFSVAEALRTGIQVAAAVETAHRAGVLHRDIKPANILVTEYNRPALTDFGIASSDATGAGASAGLSIPWSPPESFADAPQSGPRSDVYALGATLYSLLAGRSPFETPGRRNTGADLIERIVSQPLPPLERPDAPRALVGVLERAMAKNPGDRFDSAVAFARALQKVQIELAHSVTPIDILDDAPAAPDEADDDDGLTRVRGIVSIDPQTSPAAGPTRPSAFGAPAAPPLSGAPVASSTTDAVAPVVVDYPGETVLRADASHASAAPPDPAADSTLRRPVSVAPAASQAPSPASPPAAPAVVRRRRGVWVAVGVAAALVIVGGVVTASLLTGGDAAEPSASPTAAPVDVVGAAVPTPTDLTGRVSDAGVVFTWTNPDPRSGDLFLWRIDAPGQEEALTSTDQSTVTVPADAGATCIEVLLRRADGQASQTPATGCAP
ncbi:MAG: serine/threonine protein kinase [Microbacterium sp.]|uniref:serine/threonine-protein kinase n=1 Tax=Microbacterium sp. TaxID=51671 RepID=UPI000DB60BAC|nr:serine/threonine-protein kinase [Microbacterium sp.]PZU41014.1 MAG: serine/threonine protein kinase [Microbacterium sp.]